MFGRYMRYLAALGAALMTLFAIVGLAPGASAQKQAGPTLIQGRSTIAHLSPELAALATGAAPQARVSGAAEAGPVSVQRQFGTGRLLVQIRVARWDAAVLGGLEGAGANIVHRTAELRTVTAAVTPSALLTISRLPGVQYVDAVEQPIQRQVCDSVKSEGDRILHAVDERTNHGVDGTGVTVGILSDSFDTDSGAVTHASDDVAADNLPGAANTCGHTTDVGVLQDDTSNDGHEDEGRAMAQIVHDLAPGARILFASAEGGDDVFAGNIRALAQAGADIIVDDVGYFDEPYYQDGAIADAINDVRAEGVDYFSAAGNDNIILDGHDVGSYEAVGGYRTTDCPSAAFTASGYTDCHNFNGGSGAADPTYGFTAQPNQTIYLTLDWAEPQYGVKTDYALCVLAGTTPIGCADTRNPGASGSQQAVEVATLQTGGLGGDFSVVVARYGNDSPDTNATPRFKLAFLTNGSGAITHMEYETPTGSDVIGPNLSGHPGTAGAVAVAASDVEVSPSTVDAYSSRGPVTLLYGPVDGTTPAAALATPQVEAKPDLTASDCGINSFFGFPDGSHYRFCGTSAAAPHAAAVAALLLQQHPGYTPDQVNAALTWSASDLGLPAAAQGAGLVDAAAAGDTAVPATQTISFAQPAPGAVGGSRTLSATASSGLPVSLTISPQTRPAGACTLSGAAVTYAKAGTCVIDADQSGNDLYAAATEVARTITISAVPAVTTTSLPAGVVGKPYSAKLMAGGGTTPLTWRVSGGALPPGLTLAKSGALTGTPRTAGSFRTTVTVTDSSSPKASAAKSLTIAIVPIAVRTARLPAGVVGSVYSARLQAYGGTAPLSWQVMSGTLPAGLSLARSGQLSGKPTKRGSFAVTVRVTDAAHKHADKGLTIVVRPT